jgi:uridine phosphorylase
MGKLAELGAKPVTRRVIEHLGLRLLIAAGVSSGIDMALRLAELLVDTTAAKATQTLIEYDPEPPFDAGHPSKVDAAVMARVDEYRAVRA